MKIKYSVLAIVCIISLFPTVTFSFWENRVEKAQELKNRKMFEQALAVLNDEIMDKPKNADAYYLMAVIMVEYCPIACMQKIGDCFKAAYDSDPKTYGKKIGEYFIERANLSLEKNLINAARADYFTATNFNPDLKKIALEKMMYKLQILLDPEKVGAGASAQDSNLLLQTITMIDPSYKQQIEKAQIAYAEECLRRSENLNNETAIEYRRQASFFLKDVKVKKEAGWREFKKKEFIGVGKIGGDDPKFNDGGVNVLLHNVDIQVGYRYTVINDNCEVWRSGKWEILNKGDYKTVTTVQKNEYTNFRGERGKKYIIIIEYLSN